MLNRSSCLNLLLLLFATASSSYALKNRAANTCDPSKENLGCSQFGRCEQNYLQCRCNPGFSGDGLTCESACTSANTTCTTDNLSCIDLPQASMPYGCLCNKGYQWSPGGMKCIDTDECTQRRCSPLSKCINEEGDYECQCCYSSEGFEGISGFGYIGDGKTKCYADSIIHYGDSERSRVLTNKGALHTSVPGGFPFFGKLYWDIYFHTDGLITFEYPEAPYLGGDAFPTRRQVKFVAPFWTDLAMPVDQPGSGLYVDEYTLYSLTTGKLQTGSSSVDAFLPKLRSWIDEINLEGFVPSQIVTATWVNMTANSAATFSSSSHSRITFQVVMTTNGTHSFGFTSYAENPKDTDWDLPLKNVYIGFSGEDFATRQPIDEIGDLFEDPPKVDSICETMTFLTQRGRFYRVFGPPFTPNTNPECLQEASKQWREHQGFGIEQVDEQQSSLPPDLYCPCFEQQAYSDNRFVVRNVEAPHPDRRSCHMSRFYRRANYGDKDFFARAYCCYDSLGALVTSGPGAGGIVPQGYEMQMVTLKAKCCADADLCDVFSSIYQPINCHRYSRPRVAYIRGGGHFNGLTNQEYTFDGRGEYTYFGYRATGQIQVQIRMTDRTYESDKKTSFVSAIVVKCSVPPNIDDVVYEPRKAEVRVNSAGQLELLVDGLHVPTSGLPDEFNSTFPVGCDSQYCEIACKYQMSIFSWQIRLTNFYLRLNTTMPGTSDNTPYGLVGDISGRLLYTDGEGNQAEVTDLNDDAQLQKFGESWRIEEANSLFKYDNGDSWATYNEGDYTPTFWSDIKETIDVNNIDQICHCEGDHACQYDQLVTGDKDISSATYEAKQIIDLDRAALATKTPQWQIGQNLILSIHQDFAGNLSEYVKYDEFFEYDMNEDDEETKRNTRQMIVVDEFDLTTTLNPEFYNFDEKTGEFVIKTTQSPDNWRYNSFSVLIYAIKHGSDGVVARSRYSPNIFICACDKEEQCDFSFAENRTALQRSTSDDNHYLLPCKCPPTATDPFCEIAFDPCSNSPCDMNAACQVSDEKSPGYICTCNQGYSGNGLICTINQCPADHGCSQNCHLDPDTAEPVCSCDMGYILQSDGRFCLDRNECNFPMACLDDNAICTNTPGAHYCQCAAGYKPEKGFQRTQCIQTNYTYVGSLTFEHYWDFQLKSYQGWSDDLGKPESHGFAMAARQLETMVEELIKLMEPTTILSDLFTYVYRFSKETNNKIKMSYKVFPRTRIDADVVQKSLVGYFTVRAVEAAGFSGIVADQTTFIILANFDHCLAATPSCQSPFAYCQNSDFEKNCRCNPGFILDNLGYCNSYCYTRQCSPTSSYSCRDLAQVGPECLCKKGYTLDAYNTCQKISACPTDSNPCGSHSICNDLGDGTYSCSCEEGYVKASNPMPDICVPDVMFCQDGATNSYPDSVTVTPYASYYKVAIPVGFPYFDTKQWKLYIGPNGIITFGKNVTASELRSSHPSTYGYVIAPLWSDYIWDRSKIKFNIYDSTTSDMTPQWQIIIDQIRNATRVAQATYPSFTMAGYASLEDPSKFDPKTIVMVTWSNLQLKPFTAIDKVTMQAIIASDGVATVVIWNYDTASMSVNSWEDPAVTPNATLAYPHRGFVGFQGGSRQFCLNRVGFAESLDDCRSFVPSQLTEPKGRYALPPGRHVFLVANDAKVKTTADRQCFEVMNEYGYSEELKELVYVYSSLDFQAPTQPCPWTETQVQLDGRFSKLIGIIGKSCYSTGFSSPFTYLTSDGSNKDVTIRPYCCYRSNALLMQPSSGTHMIVDQYAYLQKAVLSTCCQSSAHCILASYYVPPNYVTGYEPPATAAIFGDPHLITFDGLNVTFKGRGDYVLFNSSQVSIQGRFASIGFGVINGSALMGIAWHVVDTPKVVILISDVDGTISMTSNEADVNLADFASPSAWKMDGNIQAFMNDDKVEEVTVTYNDGLKFHVSRKQTKDHLFYLHATIRMPRNNLREQNSGLLSDFILPDGTSFQPKFYGTLFIGDEHYFTNYGKHWSVSQAMIPSLFPTPYQDDEYVPEFYESYLIDLPDSTPVLDMCFGQMTCAYDYTVTGDIDVAGDTLRTLSYSLRQRQWAVEKPPTFKGSNPVVWLINVRSYYITFTPELEDPSPDVTFSMDTDFPQHLYKIDPLSGTIVVIMTDEARDTFLNKGPFNFYMIARRGESGAAAYKPLAVRICNCLDERSCDYSDDYDAIFVGIVPTENAARYSIARCNCFSFQTGKFCDERYNACGTAPCYPASACFPLSISDMLKESFSCGSCPTGYKGNGYHCVVNDPCLGVICSGDKVCANVNGNARCVCPEMTTTLSDGSCQYQNACELGTVCTGDGQRCNPAPQGKYFCDCMPGYAPRNTLSPLLELSSCQRVSYTYVGSLSFSYYYNTTTKDLEVFSPNYRRPETDEYRTFARRILYDLENAASLIKSDIVSGYIRDVRPLGPDNGFTVDWLAYSLVKLNPAEIESKLALYFSQTNKVGVIVYVLNNSTFVDICDSNYSPCHNIASISSCSQPGILGQGAVCACNAVLGYQQLLTPNGNYACLDVCDSQCKANDSNSQCTRVSPTAMYTCPCMEGHFFNSTANKCQVFPPICTANICGPNAYCVQLTESLYTCHCNEGYQNNTATGQCISNCQAAGSCLDVANAYGCQNLNTGHQCLCSGGYEWSAVDRTCKDIDECTRGLHACSQYATCLNEAGSYSCACKDDFTAFGSVCYAKTSNIIYPYNFDNQSAIRKTDWQKVYDVFGGFPYFNNFFYRVEIDFNGFIGLGALPPPNYYGSLVKTHLIAPFWMPLDVLPDDPTSGLYVDSHDFYYTLDDAADEAKWQAVFDLAQQHLDEKYPDIEHPPLVTDESSPWVMIIATWAKVTPAPASSYSNFHTTFQVILGANSGFSFAIFNYLNRPDETNWPTADKLPQLQPRIGYTTGIDEVDLVSLNGNPPDFWKIFEHQSQLPGRIVQAFGEPLDVENRKCLVQYKKTFSSDFLDIQLGLNEEGSGLERHAACPAFLRQAEFDARWQPEILVGRSLCYGGSFWNRGRDVYTNRTYNVRSFCCYDWQSGAFLSYSSNRHMSSFIQVKELRAEHEALFNPCCRNSQYCELFSLLSPSEIINPENYDQPIMAFVRGDPHIGMPLRSIDEGVRQLTFNGIGEYTLLKTNGNFEGLGIVNVQIRFGLRDDVTKLATFVTGIAIQAANSDTIEVFFHMGDVYLLKNGILVDLNSIFQPTFHDVVDESSYDLWANFDYIGYVTGYGLQFQIYLVDDAYFNIRISLPRDLTTVSSPPRTCGLLTSFDSAPYLDCDNNAATGDIWNSEEDAYNFAQHFKLTDRSQSLFSYKVGPMFDDVNMVPLGWMPIFAGEIAGYPTDVDEVCGVDKACRYDYAVTLNSRIASDTEYFGKLLLQAQSFSVMIRPQITNSDYQEYLFLSTPGLDNEIDVNSDQEGTDGFRYELITNLEPEWYTFNEMTGVFRLVASEAIRHGVRQYQYQAPYLRFVARKDEATDLWAPTLWTDACEDPSQANFGYSFSAIFQREKTSTHNYFLPCICPVTAYGSKFCEKSFNPCAGNPCSGLSECILDDNSPNGFKCGACPDGYMLVDGYCKPKLCPTGTCTNGDCQVSSSRDDSYVCKCWSGYEISPYDSYVCRDINECQLGTHDCFKYGSGMTCTNTPGKWVCGCRTGYAPNNASDFQTCEPVENQIYAKIAVQSVIVGTEEITWSDELNDPSSERYVKVAEQMRINLLSWLVNDLRQKVTSIVINKLTQGSIEADYSINSDEAIDAAQLAADQKAFLDNGGTVTGLVGADASSVAVVADPCATDTKCDLTSTSCRWDTAASIARCDCLDGFVEIAQSDSSCADNCTAMCEERLGVNSKCSRSGSTYSCNCISGYHEENGRCTNKCENSPCQNGGTCAVFGTNSYICQCAGDFIGTDCETQCACVNGVCADKTDLSKCTCNPGYTGTNCELCADGYENDVATGNCISKCAINPCQNSGVCAISGNSAVCICRPDFTGPTCLTPVDTTDACTVNPCSNGATCGLTQSGGFICQCPIGYVGATCQLECKCINGGFCYENGGAAECRCPAGYGGDYCQDIVDASNKCTPNPCQNSGLCAQTTEVADGYICRCLDTHVGSTCQFTCGCQNGGLCYENAGVAMCRCPSNYEGDKCQTLIDPSDKCSPNPCLNSGICAQTSDVAEGFICRCPSSHVGPLCETACQCQNGGICFDNSSTPACYCLSGYTGANCEQAIDTNDACTNSPCMNGGTCGLTHDGSICQCPSDHVGPTCQLACQCENGGFCFDNTGVAACLCPSGYSGDRCQDFDTTNKCTPNPCLNNGICAQTSDVADGYVCRCPSTHIGQTCQTECRCENGGICFDNSSTPACYCQPGFTGANCAQIINTTDACSSNPCMNEGACGLTPDGFLCKCPATHVGLNCQLECKCQNGAACFEQGSTAMCRCPAGFTGTNCETAAATSCTVNPCQNNGTCGVTTTGFVCECSDNFYGRTCSKRCDCQNGGVCDSLADDGSCLCHTDFTGSKCELKYVEPVSGDETLIIVSAVLGSVVFVLISIIAFVLIRGKKALSSTKKSRADSVSSTSNSGQVMQMKPVPNLPVSSPAYGSSPMPVQAQNPVYVMPTNYQQVQPPRSSNFQPQDPSGEMNF